MRTLTRVSLVASLLPLLVANARPEFSSIQERAQGYSLTGALLQNDSIYSNPASSAFTSVYSVEAAYAAPRSFGISILDTKTSAVGGMVGYFREPGAMADKPNQGLKLGLVGRANQTFGLGLAGKSVWGTTGDGQNYRLNDVDTGILVNLNPLLLGASIRNMLGGSAISGLGRELSIGAQISYDQTLNLSMTAQSAWGVWNPEQYGIGVEYVSPFFFSIKGGYRIRPREQRSFWSAGASLLSPRIHLHYAAEFPQNTATESVAHSFAAAMQL